MQKMMGLVRRCIEDYNMIEAGDRVAVGVSGGKDSLTLLVLLAALREYYPIKFDLAALSVDMGHGAGVLLLAIVENDRADLRLLYQIGHVQPRAQLRHG